MNEHSFCYKAYVLRQSKMNVYVLLLRKVYTRHPTNPPQKSTPISKDYTQKTYMYLTQSSNPPTPECPLILHTPCGNPAEQLHVPPIVQGGAAQCRHVRSTRISSSTWKSGSACVDDGLEQVEVVNTFAAALAFDNAVPGQYQRHLDGFLDHVQGKRAVAFAPNAVVAAIQSVIGRVHDHRIFIFPDSMKRIDHATDAFVD